MLICQINWFNSEQAMKLDEKSESPALKVMKSASKIAKENGISDMTSDEINAEIAEPRGRAT